METCEEWFSKQYCTYPQNSDMETQSMPVKVCSLPRKEFYRVMDPYPRPFTTQFEEPIDLTRGTAQVVEIKRIDSSGKLLKRTKGRRPKAYSTNEIMSPYQTQGFFEDIMVAQSTEDNEAEILKAAKSLFSKRTRTLYRWMYPNTSKQQIKLAVANSWENLKLQEKQFYISQVLVRFGFPQGNLMINPQLGEMPNLLLTTTGPNNNVNCDQELNTAITSISNPNIKLMEKKRRQGRPLGSKNKKRKNNFLNYKTSKDFQDDPELSTELEKFAVSFDYFK